jgi:methionyl-tRNA synthetase
MPTWYGTTPIYYVNERPHLGHCYTTLVTDVAARFQRLIRGGASDVFFLTGTDEHAEKVVISAREHGVTPMEWATTNAERFKEAFAFMGFSNDDFIRTTEERHRTRAAAYIEHLVKSGDIELGDYEGWFDPSQEEYVTETTAKENDFKSPVTGKPLEKRTEQNYFFRLDKPEFARWLLETIEKGDRGEPGGMRILPEARRNEVLGRIKGGLQRVPVSRRIKPGDVDWGIGMPGDPEHRIYVWIEALCNYLTTMDTPERRRFWPAPEAAGSAAGDDAAGVRIVHLMAKDILWFHAVIWPCLLHALGERPPSVVYAHAYWIAEGRKMSKSLGNFIEIDQLRAYAERYSLDALRWFLVTQGPLGATDADFAHGRFIDVYNSELANGVGNCASRVSNMIAKYFDGAMPEPGGKMSDLEAICTTFAEDVQHPADNLDLERALLLGDLVISKIDGYINDTRPFSLAKQIEGPDDPKRAELGAILYNCAEALRIASLAFYPAMPAKMTELWQNLGARHLRDPADPDSGFTAPLSKLAKWNGEYGLKPGQPITKGGALFMRADPAEPPPPTSPRTPADT